MKSVGKLVVVGDLVWDVLARPDTPLLPGGDVTGRVALAPGGSAANTAVWMARSGAATSFVGRIGADAMGDLLATDLTHEGLEVLLARDQHHDTGVVLLLIDGDGQRSSITNQGADFQLLTADLPVATLESARHIHLTAWSLFTEPPRQAAVRAAQLAKASGASVSLDPSSYQMIEQFGRQAFVELIAQLQIDIICPNIDEACTLTGETEPLAIARVLREQVPGVMVVLKLGADGCYVVNAERSSHYPAPAVAPLDTTGAGDAFAGVFLAHYLHTGNIAEAARHANTVGAWVVTQRGARPPITAALQQEIALTPAD